MTINTLPPFGSNRFYLGIDCFNRHRRDADFGHFIGYRQQIISGPLPT